MGESMLQGAIIGLVVGAVMVVVFFILAKNKKPEIDMKARKTTAVETPLAPADAFEKLRDNAGKHALTVPLADNAAHKLVLSDGMTLFSWGMFYPVSVEATGSGARVTVGVSPKTPQWGPVIPHKLEKAVGKVRTILAG